MHLRLKGLTGTDKDIEIDGSATVGDFKKRVFEHELIPPMQQRLICNGRILLKDDDTLSQYRVGSGNVIHMVLALRGG